MKNRLFLFVFLAFLIAGLGIWLWISKNPQSKFPIVAKSNLTKKEFESGQRTEPPPTKEEALTSPEIQEILNNPTTAQKLKDEITNNPVAALMRIRAAQGVWDKENNTSINFYGKVVDQYGQPVSDVQVEFGVMLYGGFTQSKSETYHSMTDPQGQFSFTHLQGVDFGVNFKKEGYYYDLKLSSKRPPNYYTTNADHPLVYTLWKLRGAEPMAHLPLVQGGIPCDGTETSFNLLTGKKSDPQKDMVVTLTRNPVIVTNRNVHFDYTFSLNIADGGLVEATDEYPYLAPEQGYQPIATFTMAANAKDWTARFDRLYYFKARNGQVYGRIKIHLTADYEGPTTHFEFELYANPSGSRNLEFDPKKQIKLP